MSLSVDFRAKAKSLDEATTQLIGGLEPQAKNFLASVVGQVNAAMYAALADVLDDLASLPANQRAEALKTKQAEFAAKNDAIRKAAALGVSDVDWNRIIGGEALPG